MKINNGIFYLFIIALICACSTEGNSELLNADIIKYDNSKAEGGIHEIVEANELMAAQKYLEAIIELEKAQTRVLNSPDVELFMINICQKMGICHMRLSNFQESIENYSKVLSYEPDNFGALLNRSFAYRSLGKIEKALDDNNKAITFYPNRPEPFLNIAEINVFRNELDSACQNYRHAKKIGTNLSEEEIYN
ncbi:MAG: hypothetical protein GQ574_24960 [Crocinitomix sp.]|nr:hypothetical protein [Crocinitomix sp.]